jgi:hypothetical protein
MTFSEALGRLAAELLKDPKAGDPRLGGMICTQLQQYPDRFNGVFTQTPDKPYPHFQTTLPNDRVWYLRLTHRKKPTIHFGEDP